MTPGYLLDTSVYSQPLRRRPVMAALGHWRDAGDGKSKVSVVSVAEVEFGLHLEGRAARHERYRQLLADRLDIISTDRAVWEDFARRKARQQILGLPVSDLDLLIATCAAWHHLTVATLNTQDFSRIEGCAWEVGGLVRVKPCGPLTSCQSVHLTPHSLPSAVPASGNPLI